MAKKIFFLLIICLTVILSYPEESNDINYTTLKNNYFPCDEGSENEKRLISFIEDFSKKNLLKFKIDEIQDEDEITNSKNIEIRLDSDQSSDQDIIIFCPLNSQIIYQQYHDVSLSLNIMFNLMSLCKKNNYNKNLIFLFSGANGRDNNYEYYGLRKYLSTRSNLNKCFFIILDIFSEDAKIKFTGSFNKKPTPSKILNTFLHLDKNNLNIYYDKNEFIKSKFNLIPINNFETFLLNKNINSISFTNRSENESSVFYFNSEYTKNLTNYFFQWIGMFDGMKFPIDLDYNYNYISIFGYHILIPENIIIIVLLIIIFLSIFIRLFLPHLQRLRLSLIIKTLPYLIFLFSVFYILSFIPFIIFIPVEILTGIKKIYLNFYVLYFFNIFFVPILIIFIMFELLNKLPFPKHNYIYIFGSIIVTFINLIFFLVVDISLVYIILWVLVLITLSNFTGKKIILKFIFYLLTPLPLIILIYNLSFGNADLIKSSFQTPLLQHLVFCFTTYPFLLLMMRIRLITRYKYKIFLHKSIYILVLLGVIIISIIILVIISVKIFPEEPIIYSKILSTSNSTTLILNSNTVIGKINYKNNDKNFSYNFNTDYKEIKIGNYNKPYKIIFNKTKFGNNRLYNVKIASEFEMEYIKINLTTPASYNPLESNYSYNNITQFSKENLKEEIYEFKIPRNQGKYFDLNLYMIPNDQYKIHIEIIYPFFINNSIEISKNAGHIYKYSTFIDEFKL